MIGWLGMSEAHHYVSSELQGVPGKLELGRWLSATARVISENLPVLLIGSSIILLPHLALTVGIELFGVGERLVAEAAQGRSSLFDAAFMVSMIGGAFALGIVQWLLTAISQGAVIYVVVQWLNGRKASLGAALSVSWSSLGSILVTSLLVGLATFVGLIFCIVPGIIVACCYFVAIPVTITERLDAMDAMKRSLSLTQSNRMIIFLAMLIYVALLWGLSALGSVLAWLGPGPVTQWLQVGMTWGLTVLQTVVAASGAAVAYVQIRGVRDGVSAEELASVFA